MANLIGVLFVMIAVIMLLFFGMGATTDIISGTNISAGDANYDNFQTAQNATQVAYSGGSIMPLILGLAVVIGGFVLLMSVFRGR